MMTASGLKSGDVSKRVTRLAEEQGRQVSIDPATIAIIAELVISTVARCWKEGGVQGSVGIHPSEYVSDHYDESNKQFEPVITSQVRGQVRRGIRRSHHEQGTPALNKFSPEEIDLIAQAFLYESMEDPQTTSACVTEIFN